MKRLSALLGSFEPDADPERSQRLLRLLSHPVVIPPLVFGIYLRTLIGPARGDRRRELSLDEADSAWRESAPHLLAVWIVVCTAVVVASVARLVAQDALTPSELAADGTTACLVALWVLTPLTYSHDLASTVGAVAEAALTVVVCVLVVKIAAFATHIVTMTLWWVLKLLLPYEVPAWIRDPVDAFAGVGAELLVFVVLLGYTWTKAREHFGRWATVRSSEVR